MKSKNATIYLWLFIFIVSTSLTNLNNYIWKGNEENLIFTGGNFLVFLMLIAGYYLMKYMKEAKRLKDESSSARAWKYFKHIFSKLFPIVLCGVLFTFIVRHIITGTSFLGILNTFMNSILEFFGFASVGSAGILEQTSGAVLISGTTPIIWNAPLWIASSIIIVSYILYFIADKSEDIFKGIFAPIIIIGVYGYFGFNMISNANYIPTFPMNILRVAAGMTLGMLIYYVVDYTKKRKLTDSATMAISIIHITLAMVFAVLIFQGSTWNMLTQGLLVLIFTTILLIDNDYISVLYNKSSSIVFLGKLSIYYYACHIGFIFLLRWLFPNMTYYASLGFNILFSLCFGFILMYLDQYVITPLLGKIKLFKKEKNTVK